MKAQHDNLQPMAPIRPLEETRLYKVIRAARREVDASVRQAVAVEKEKKKRSGRLKEHPWKQRMCLQSAPLGSFGSSLSQRWDLCSQHCQRASQISLRCMQTHQPSTSLYQRLLAHQDASAARSWQTSPLPGISGKARSEAYLNMCCSEVAAIRSLA